MSKQDQEGDTPAGMPGGKAALRQQMFEMARQAVGQDELESVAFQAQAETKTEEADQQAEASQETSSLAPRLNRGRGLRKVERRKSPPEDD